MNSTTAATLRQTYRSSVEAIVAACTTGNDDRAISLLYTTRDLINAMPAADRVESARHLRATFIDLRTQGNLTKRLTQVAHPVLD